MKRSYEQRLIHARLLHELLSNSVCKDPDKTALIIEGKAYSYGRFYDAAMNLAGHLRMMGVERGDRVVIFMDNTWPSMVSVYGAQMSGAVFVLVNPLTKADKLGYIVEDSGARVLLTDSHLARVFLGISPRILSRLTIICSNYSGKVDTVQGMSLLDFERLIAEEVPGSVLPALIPLDLAALIYTSGSTGFPKGVMHTHQSMVFSVRSLVEYLRLNSTDRIFLALPMAFDYGLYQLLMAMTVGATLVVERSFTYLGLVLKRLWEQEITCLPAVPTVFSMLIAAHHKNALSFPSIEIVTSTAADLPAEQIPELMEIFPNALIFKMYGLTECKRVSYLDPERLKDKPTSVGRAIPGTEILLLDEEGDPVQPGEVGILHVRGPHIMLGYWRMPERSREMLKPGPLPGERILCTHDRFRMDEDGDLYFLGRSDDIIKSRGEKVSPVEVERVVHQLDGVCEAAVVAAPDELLGEAIILYVSVEEGYCLSVSDIKRHCIAHMENFMIPKHIYIRASLPKTANGKIDKLKLAQESQS